MQVARINSLPTASAIALTIAAVMLPGSATAKIVVGQSVAGVRLDDSKARVKSLLGRPNCQSCGAGKVVWSFGAPLIGSIGFDSRGRVDGVSTSSAHQSTTKGIHPYSSQRARNGLPTIAGSTRSGLWGRTTAQDAASAQNSVSRFNASWRPGFTDGPSSLVSLASTSQDMA